MNFACHDQTKKMKNILTTAFIALLALSMNAQDLISNTGSVTFNAPKEKGVTATSQSLTSKINLETKEIVFSVPIQAFKFASSRMQGHFNQEGVMNSAEYPKAKFKGTIITDADLSIDGTYAVTVEGEMTIRGASNTFTSEGEVIVKDGKVEVRSSFVINAFEFGIDSKDFGDVVEVTLNALYE